MNETIEDLKLDVDDLKRERETVAAALNCEADEFSMSHRARRLYRIIDQQRKTIANLRKRSQNQDVKQSPN